jgi:MFS superfamily sulfate permease-like transporter
MDMQRFLIGLVILIVGIAWPLVSRIGLGRLPGDIVLERGGTSFYFPIVTCIIVSIVLSAIFLVVQSLTVRARLGEYVNGDEEPCVTAGRFNR